MASADERGRRAAMVRMRPRGVLVSPRESRVEGWCCRGRYAGQSKSPEGPDTPHAQGAMGESREGPVPAAAAVSCRCRVALFPPVTSAFTLIRLLLTSSDCNKLAAALGRGEAPHEPVDGRPGQCVRQTRRG